MGQIGRFQLHEALLLNGSAEEGGELRSKQEMTSGFTPPHVEVAPSRTCLAVGLGTFDGEGKCRSGSQHFDSAIGDFNLTDVRVLVVRSGTGTHDA